MNGADGGGGRTEALGALLREAVPAGSGRFRELLGAAEAAVAGGAAVMERYGRDDIAVRHKGEDDPVTAADHAANRRILQVLRARFPGEPIRSEESLPLDLDGTKGNAALPERLWVVDPLDGTKEFLARNGEFAVMVGLAEGGAASVGAVYQPDPGLLYLGIVGAGAWVVAGLQQEPAVRPLRVPAAAGGRLRFVRSRSHPSAELQRLTEALGDVEIIISGSVGIKCALVATRSADLYVHPVPYIQEWDTCGPEALLRGAGGVVTDCRGEPLRYGKGDPAQAGGIFAATPAVSRRVAPLVRTVAPARRD